MPRWTRRLTAPALFAAALAGVALADDTAPATRDKAPAVKLPTYKVVPAPFRVEVSLKGVFESAGMTEVLIKPEAWTGGLTVVKAVEPGAAVKPGDVLLSFDREKIDKAIRDLEAEQQLADLAIRQSELELPILERSTPLEMAAAERAKDRTDEDLRKFLATDKPLAVESAQFQVRNAANFLEYAEEELKQLQKMYRKDLTEETEEIILKRQRNQVEQAKFNLKMAENRRDQSLKVDLPRREQDLRDMSAKAGIAWEKAQHALPLALNQRRLALEKSKYERARGAERLANLKKDRDLFTVKSPAEGVVYYGLPLPQPPPVLDDSASLPSPERLETLARTDPVAFLRAALLRYQREVHGYRATLQKQETLNGRLGSVEILDVAFREQPFSVLLRWQTPPAGMADRALYVAGQNDGLALARGKYLHIIHRPDPYSADAQSAGRYPLPEFGIGKGTERTLRAWQAAQGRGNLKTEYLGVRDVPEAGGVKCYVLRRTCDPPEEDGIVTVEVSFDTAHWLQVGNVLSGADNRLVAAYFFRDLVLNPAFPPDQFDPAALKRD